MLKHHISGPELLFTFFPGGAARVNETLLVPWKLLALGVHATGLITVTHYRDTLLSFVLPDGVSAEDRSLERSSMNVSLALTYICVFVSAFAMLSARTITVGPVNLISAVGHSVSGILLMLIWINDAHVVRIWHTFFVFTMVPALLEFAVTMFIRMKGTYMW
jgi:hypothetical protein